MHLRQRHLIVCILSLLVLGGCSTGNMDDLTQYVQETKAKFKGNIEQLPNVLSYETYRYQSSDLRDPFKPSISLVKTAIQKRNDNGISPKTGREKESLEAYALDTLNMVGILDNQGETWAIIKAPDGNIYRVRKGNYLGRNHGKILAIHESNIELKEIVPDGLDGWIERPNTISLAQ